MIGWIRLHRSIKEHWIYNDEKKLKWWIDILLSVNHKDNSILIKGQLIECKRGQSVRSLDTWAKDWNTTKKTVSLFFKLLEKDKMIFVENLKISTRLTVCNYDSYQDSVNDEETLSKRKVNDEETLSKRTLPSNNNDNNDNNVNNVKKGKESENFFCKISDEVKDFKIIQKENEQKEAEWKKIKDEYWNSHERLNLIAKNSIHTFRKQITYPQLKEKLKEFGLLLNARGETKESINELNRHFVNWLKLNLKNNEPEDAWTSYQKINSQLIEKYNNYEPNQLESNKQLTIEQENSES